MIIVATLAMLVGPTLLVSVDDDDPCETYLMWDVW